MKDNHHKLSRKLDTSPCPAHPCHSPGAISTLLALSPWPHRPFRPLKAASPAPGRDSGRAPPASPLLLPWSLDKGEPGSMHSDVGGT